MKRNTKRKVTDGRLVVAVTNDELELPIAVADTFNELDDLLHVKRGTTYHLSRNVRPSIVYSFNVRLTDYEEDDSLEEKVGVAI